MWELDGEESWAMKNWCFWTVVLEKTLESPLDCKEIQPVHPKGDQYWVFIGRTDAKAETPILWSFDEKSWLIGKDPDSGREWGLEEKGMTEDEMAGCITDSMHMSLCELWELVMDRETLECCDPWGCKELDTTEWLKWTELSTAVGSFSGGTSHKEHVVQCRRHKRCRFDPRIRKIPWKRAWQPTLVFLLGESHGQGSLVGYSPWSCGVRHDWSDLVCTHSRAGTSGVLWVKQ